MGVSLSIKDVPEALAEKLRQRAALNHRSLQRELMVLIEAATRGGIPTSIAAQEVETAYAVRVQAAPTGPTDDLLAELDSIVVGSRWGTAPLLSREQAHDRALARELDFDARTQELQAARTPPRRPRNRATP